MVRDENHLGHDQREDGRAQKGRNANAKLPQHQRLSKRKQLKGVEEKHGDRDQLPQFVLKLLRLACSCYWINSDDTSHFAANASLEPRMSWNIRGPRVFINQTSMPN